MKRAYSKPELFCEDFKLSESIAGNCGNSLHKFNITSADVNTCGYLYGGDVLFVSSGICEILAGDFGTEEEFEGLYGFCYHSSGDNSVVFSS